MPLYMDDQQFQKYITDCHLQCEHFSIKNKDSLYIASNERLARFLGFKKYNDLIGLTDKELKCDAAERAEIFQKNDLEILTSKKDSKSFCFCSYASGWRLLFASQNVICNQYNESIGIMTISHDITSLPMLNAGITFNPLLREKIQKREPFLVTIVEQYPNLDLTKKQSLVLFYVVHGYNTKETARILNVSPHTIERHLEDIKFRLQCTNKAQLLEKAVAYGLLNFVLTSEETHL